MACPYWNLEIPPNTPPSNPIKLRKGIKTGRIAELHVYFPAGCSGLVGVQVNPREHIIAPADKGEWIKGDDVMWPWILDYIMYGGGNYVGLLGYNLDEIYSHEILIAISLLPRRGWR